MEGEMSAETIRWRPPVWFMLLAAALGIALGEVIYRSWTGPVLLEPLLQEQLRAKNASVLHDGSSDLPEKRGDTNNQDQPQQPL